MDSHPPKTCCPDALCLPFGGLGLDVAEVRHAVRDLRLAPVPRWTAPEALILLDAPPAPSGYGLLVRLSRETLGS